MKKLSIVIPVYNEKDTLEEILKRVEAVALPLEKEIIIVDDGSCDGTREILKILPRAKHQIIFQEKNSGKGAAVKRGFLAATGDIVLIQDADLEYDPQEYPLVIEPILNGQADAVFSSRFISSRPHRVLYFWHYLGNRLITTLSNIFTNLNLTDVESCYKAFSRPALEKIRNQIRSRRFGIEPELVALAAKNKLRVYEVGVSYFGRTYEEGKKINWRDGLAAIWHIIKFALRKK